LTKYFKYSFTSTAAYCTICLTATIGIYGEISIRIATVTPYFYVCFLYLQCCKYTVIQQKARHLSINHSRFQLIVNY